MKAPTNASAGGSARPSGCGCPRRHAERPSHDPMTEHRDDDRPRPWPDLDRAAAAEAWTALYGWIATVLVVRYPHVTYPEGTQLLPPCWYRHPWLVEELSALHTAWFHAYKGPASSPCAPNDWHGLLDETSTRVALRNRCQSGHVDDPPAEL